MFFVVLLAALVLVILYDFEMLLSEGLCRATSLPPTFISCKHLVLTLYAKDKILMEGLSLIFGHANPLELRTEKTIH